MKKPPDLAAIKAARERLDEIAREHPELVHPGPPSPADVQGWEETLQEEEDDMATRQVAFRLPVELVERLDALAKRMQDESPGLRVTRADVVRLLLTSALNEDDDNGPSEQEE